MDEDLTLGTYTIWPTSASSAEGEPIVLRQTDQRRLVFKPTLVDNPGQPAAVVRGAFVYQRKRKAEDWEDHSKISLTQLRAGDWIRLELTASEVLLLLRNLSAIVREVRKSGLPKKRITFIRLDADADAEDAIQKLDVGRLFRLIGTSGFDLVQDLFDWVVSDANADRALAALSRLSSVGLNQLGAVSQQAALISAAEEWEALLQASNEEQWQVSLQKHAAALSLVLSHPLVLVQGKAYVGGKSIDNAGGNLADFLAKNPVTGNVAIIEIKTPSLRLLGPEYRTGGIFPLSPGLSGAIGQVLTYRHSLLSEYHTLVKDEFEVFRPEVIIIGGNAGAELDTREKRRSFELGRGELKDVRVVTFDELVHRAKGLAGMLSGASP